MSHLEDLDWESMEGGEWDPAFDAYLEASNTINPIDFSLDESQYGAFAPGSLAQAGERQTASGGTGYEDPSQLAAASLVDGTSSAFPESLNTPVYSFVDGTQMFDDNIGWFWLAPAPRYFQPKYRGPAFAPPVESPTVQRKRKASVEGSQGATRKRKAGRVEKRASETTYPCICATSPNIPRPLNSWIIFRREQGPAQKKLHPNASTPELSKILGEIWARAAPQTKARYTELARDERRRHTERYPNYKYDPSRGQRKKFGEAGTCQCGAYERNTMYKSLRRDGMEPAEAMAQVEQRYSGVPGPSPSILQLPGRRKGHLQSGNRPVEDEAGDIVQRMIG